MLGILEPWGSVYVAELKISEGSLKKSVRNLRPVPLTELPDRNPIKVVELLFRQAESGALAAIEWYLWKKALKSRWSRILRATAVILAVCGGTVPLIHAAEPSVIAAEWGYVVLAVSAGCVLFDRYFGFTSSWMRYMRTQSRLHRILALAQVDWAAGLLRIEENQEGASLLLPIVRRLIDDTTQALEGETGEWATELTVQLEKLNQQTQVDGSR